MQQKKRRTLVLIFSTPSGARTALLAVGSRVLESLHPPNLPEREEQSGFSFPQGAQKSEKLLFLASVPPQVVLVMRCAPAQVDFCTLVWLWSSKNVASQNQRESAMISRYKYRNFALKSQITTHHFHRSSDAQNHRYHNRQLTHPLNQPSCHYRVCGIDLCQRRYNPNPHRSETMGIGAI